MQTVLLLAGKNSRFFPLETMSHKALFPLYGKPTVEYLVEDLVSVGVKDFAIATGQHDELIREQLGDGSRFGATIKYAIQKGDGQGEGVLAVRELINGPFMIMNPYHLFQVDHFKKILKRFKSEDIDGVFSGKYQEDVTNYGVFELKGERIVNVVEKPKKGEEPSNYRGTSAYIFKKDFFDYLEKEERHEYFFESAQTTYAKEKNVVMIEIGKDIKIPTLKYPWHLLDLRSQLSNTVKGFIHPTAYVADNVVLEESVYVDEGARIFEGAAVKGSTYVGKKAVIGNNAVVRDTDLGVAAQVGVNSDITRSIIMAGVHSHGGGFIGDSIIGNDARIAAGFVTANKRTDRENISAEVAGKKVDIKSNALGIIMGEGVKTGIGVSSMPGKLVGSKSQIWPHTVIYENLPHNTLLRSIQNQEKRQLDD
ncbi:MAG: sugar phosphate nucleotidyltransferase [Candidatus Dojkabacteria bacterium]